MKSKSVFNFFLFTIALSLFCNSQTKNNTLPISVFNVDTSYDTAYYDYSIMSRAVSGMSFLAGHSSVRDIDGHRYWAFLTSNSKHICVISTKSPIIDTINLPLLIDVPISNIYFHNSDSIFIFFDREIVLFLRENDIDVDDFILINSKGKPINHFRLDDVLNIYSKGSQCFIKLYSLRFNWNMIIDEVIYLPFTIYARNCKDNLPVIQQLCAYNLNDKSHKMLNIFQNPNKFNDKYAEKVSPSAFNYSIIDDSTLVYSYFNSSNIYKYNLKTDKSSLIASFDNFVFNNVVNPENTKIHSTSFESPIFSKKENLFFREVYVKDYLDFKDFRITQILDKDFNLIGYHFPESNFSNVFLNAKGEISVNNNSQKYIYHKASYKETVEMDIEDIKSSFLSLKKRANSMGISTALMNIPLEKRASLFLENFDIKDNSLIIALSTDIICYYCLDYLMKNMQNNFSIFKDKNIYVLFYGENVFSSFFMVSQYRLDDESMILYDNNQYLSEYLFDIKNDGKTLIFDTGKETEILKKLDFNDIIDKIDSLIKN